MLILAVFKILKKGDTGSQVQLLQLGLSRFGYNVDIDGIFGQNTYANVIAFQQAQGLDADGIAGSRTWNALMPYLTGYFRYTVQRGDTLYKLAGKFDTSLTAIETANPGIDPYNLKAGQQIVLPFGYDVVPVNISFTSTVLEICIEGLAARYPYINTGAIGSSVMGRSIWYMKMGNGMNQVFYNASHHANEWITTPLVMKFFEEYARAYSVGGSIYGVDAQTAFSKTTLFVVPMVNPDGVDLVTGELDSGAYYSRAKRLGENYPQIPFPSGWKANIDGIDTNLQYPAGWETAKQIKFAQGYTKPGPRDFVGFEPLEAPESRSVYDFTRQNNFALTISYHTQGKVIFWQYLDYLPENSYEIAQLFSKLSGYEIAQTPYESGHAGYKDWFIQDYNRPGYTIEAGIGVSPLPLSQFDEIYRDNREVLAAALTVTA